MNSFGGIEKRKKPRYDAQDIRIILRDDRNFRGEKIKDISLGGVFVRMDDPFPIGTILTLTLDPKLGLGEINLKGEVIWINSGEKKYDKGMGVKFQEVPPRVEEKLSKIFKKLRKI